MVKISTEQSYKYQSMYSVAGYHLHFFFCSLFSPAFSFLTLPPALIPHFIFLIQEVLLAFEW